MILAGIVPSSLIDYPEKIAAVVFTKGCNFRCPYCQNPELVEGGEINSLSEEGFFNFLGRRIGLLDGVVITGGEPTLQPDLLPFIEKVKNMGFLVKLDTNGSDPKGLQSFIGKDLVDYVAMDVKASPEEYPVTAGYGGSIEPILQSIEILKKTSVAMEFRTTVVPGLTDEEEMEKIARMIEGARVYYIQNFRSYRTLSEEFSEERSFSLHELSRFKKIAEKYVAFVGVRN
ncbi:MULTISPECIES: anaerobic ribonucleoside-triphosphate reductase activating protein [Aminobacterium]|uniref:anaerobic ribonucleoside-triphosphate reductase activating protein n=1 Tax=Aminobacterium TaxID=81466 RepID=UPI0025809227|nr:anaerobic ribonucleoside-triphosphate reductase activating protein [Aminobacterium sp. UBA4987]